MNYKVELSPNFKKEAKHLGKKYRSLKTDLAKLFEELERSPDLRTPLGATMYIKFAWQLPLKEKVNQVERD